jgi:hypothetical protein
LDSIILPILLILSLCENFESPLGKDFVEFELEIIFM